MSLTITASLLYNDFRAVEANAGVAQSVEQLIRNQQVVCSSHITSSNDKCPFSGRESRNDLVIPAFGIQKPSPRRYVGEPAKNLPALFSRTGAVPASRVIMIVCSSDLKLTLLFYFIL